MNDLRVFFQGLAEVIHPDMRMSKFLRKHRFLIFFLVFSLLAGTAYAAIPFISSGNFTSGGSLLVNGSMQLNGSIGQPLVGQQASAGVVLCSGSPRCATSLLLLKKVYLPLVTR